jgi:hypothetical protein
MERLLLRLLRQRGDALRSAPELHPAARLPGLFAAASNPNDLSSVTAFREGEGAWPCVGL